MVDVSVVVIVYNDEKRLPTAVQSVLNQALRSVEAVIVDDHSSDGSFAVAQRFAERYPDRVRAFRLPSNSGGCGQPRNYGIERAAGRYVMFLDSDDELDRNACRAMVRAIETTGADFVSGLCVRVHTTPRGRKEKPWYRWIYRQTRVLDSLTDDPDPLVWDTLATNKCYRRSFLLNHRLRFPTGIAYEDFLFTARAWLAARRVALIPNTVYYWHVSDSPERRSITQRRDEIGNLADRLAMHREIDALLAERGLDTVHLAKSVKFLKHDLVLHLRDLPLRTEEYRRSFLDLVGPYVAHLPTEAYHQLRPLQAICAYLVAQGDGDALLPAADALINPHKTAVPLAEREGRIYWSTRHLNDPLGRELLDVTDLGYHLKPLHKLAPRTVVTGQRVDGRWLRLSGRVTNPLGRIPTPTSSRVRGRLELTARRAGWRVFRFPLRQLVHRGDHLTWAADLDLGRVFHPIGIVDHVWDLRLVMDIDGTRVRSRLTVLHPDLDTAPLPVQPLLPGLGADQVVAEVSAKGHLALRVVPSTAVQHRARTALVAAAGTPAGRRSRALLATARRVPRLLASEQNKRWLYHTVLCRLPRHRGLAVFESHLGQRYSDSPRAIYEELRRRDLPMTAVWSYAHTPDGFPRDAVLVRRWSLRYLVALARAEYWIDNQGFPSGLRKPAHTTYLQTWHGSALKRMGFDEPEVQLRSRAARDRLRADLGRFDAFCVRSHHDMETLIPAFRLNPAVALPVGYPRNDALVRQRQQEERTGRRTYPRIGAAPHLPDHRRILLYAPTFRGRPRRRTAVRPLFDLAAFAREFGDQYVLLVRSHYLERLVVPPSAAEAVIDVSAEHDTTPLLAAADALITDYSSVMFDYVLLDRPMIYYVPDYDDYVHHARGTYFSLAEVAPGPLAFTEEELFAALRELDTADTQYVKARRAFAERFAAYDTGTAARAIVDRFFLQEGRR